MSDVLSDVSRETLDALSEFAALVQKWTRSINLISKATVAEVWERHIIDSAQIFDLAENPRRWVDLGSGGGFPGIVIGILAKDLHPGMQLVLVESDQRKSTFLRTALRELGVSGEVVTDRIEDTEPLQADVLSARALADLDTLLHYSEKHLQKAGTALFPKGARWKIEDDAARANWSYDLNAIKSKTNPEAAILKIKDIKRV